jgi:large subunit ribosomal protein L10
MKKIGLFFKETSASRIKKYIKESDAVFVIKYSGLSSPDMTALRKSLKETSARLFVVKNSVARKAFKDANIEALIKDIEGPCAIVFSKEEPVGTSKALCTFSKSNERLKFECALLNDKLIERKEIEAIANLPSKEILRAQVVMALNSPISSFVILLNQVLSKFVICIDQIKQKKEKG